LIRRLAAQAFLLGVFVGCGDGASSDIGLDEPMRVAGAQLVEAPLPSADGGPPITLVEIPRRVVEPGRAGYIVSGRAGEGSFAVHVGLEGGERHWVLPVGFPDDVVPVERRWRAELSFAPQLDLGELAVGLVAVDSAGHAGAASRALLTATTNTSTSPLHVALRWNVQADVDLHVVTPDGVDIGPKNINEWAPPKPGTPPGPPDAWRSGARMNVDSNADCLIDGLRREQISWPVAPKPGTYSVYVDLASSCGAGAASFVLEVTRRGESIRTVRGTLFDFDARTHPLGPGAAPGLLATTFDVNP